MQSGNGSKISLILVAAVIALCCVCISQSAFASPVRPLVSYGAGSILGWGSQVVGADLDGGFIAIAAGYDHSLGLKEDGSIVAWGYNGYGQCNIPSPNTGFTAIAAGQYHSLGLKEDGSIVAWGHNEYGQCNIPTPNTGFTAIAAGRYHSLGLKEDNSVVAWGYNDYCQCDIPSPNTGFTAIAAGQYHSLGLKEDGSIVAWGYNSDGQCNIPSPNTGFTAIAAGEYRSLAIRYVCQYELVGDLNDDCRVDFADVALMAGNWLIDCDQTPSENPACVPK